MPDRDPAQEPTAAPNATDPVAPATLPPAPRGDALQVGDGIGAYRVVAKLGAGGMGEVYRAADERLRREVAVKVVRLRSLSASGAVGARDRLLREAQAMARLSHPNVVAVYEAGILDEQVFIAMELVEGANLRAHLADRPRPWREVVALYLAAGRGLAAAHRASLVHRDFKPDNVLVGDDGRVRVTDFGLAGEPQEELAGAGTPGYMAPEQQGGKPVDPRSDQYAFCVSLWEGLHGERPPGGDAGAVPSWLRAVLERGLAEAPDARFPAMEPLLDALAKDPAAVRRRRLGIAGVVALAAVAGFGLVSRRGAAAPCAGARELLAGRWDADLRARVRASFMASGRGFAADTADRTAALLDRWADDWTAMREDACRATAVRHVQPEALLDLRMQCLDRRAGELGALSALLADADGAIVDRAVEAARSLPGLAGCADAAALTALVPPPDDEATRRAVALLRVRLDAARARRAAGRYREGRQLAEGVAVVARALRYPPLLADALYEAGQLQNLEEDARVAEASLRECLLAAARGHDDARAAQAWTSLLRVVGSTARRPDDALALLPGAAAAVARAGGGPELESRLETDVGTVLQVKGRSGAAREHFARAIALQEQAGAGDLERARTLGELGSALRDDGRVAEARAAYERAIELYRGALGPDHPKVANTLANLAALSVDAGEYARAAEELERAVGIYERGLGPDHPTMASALVNLGAVYDRLGEYDRAQAVLERAVAIKSKALGPDHPDVAAALANLGQLMYAQQRFAEARSYGERAVAILEKRLGPEDPEVASYRLDVARAWQAEGRYEEARAVQNQAIASLEKSRPDSLDLSVALSDLAYTEAYEERYDAAIRLVQRVLAIREKVLGPQSPRVVVVITFLAQLLDGTGRGQEALAQHERAIAILEQASGPDDLALAAPRVAHGECLLGLKRPAEAIVTLERALAIYLAHGAPRREVALTRFRVAQALWMARRDRPRARQLARQALDGLTGLEGARNERLRAGVAAWMRANGV